MIVGPYISLTNSELHDMLPSGFKFYLDIFNDLEDDIEDKIGISCLVIVQKGSLWDEFRMSPPTRTFAYETDGYAGLIAFADEEDKMIFELKYV